MSALLLKQRPVDLSSPLEVFMVARLRGAQVSHDRDEHDMHPTDSG
jgi:hypothetical protein